MDHERLPNPRRPSFGLPELDIDCLASFKTHTLPNKQIHDNVEHTVCLMLRLKLHIKRRRNVNLSLMVQYLHRNLAPLNYTNNLLACRRPKELNCAFLEYIILSHIEGHDNPTLLLELCSTMS